MNFKEYKQHVEQCSLGGDSRFKVIKNLSSKITVDLNSGDFYFGTFIVFDKKAKDMSEVRFGKFDGMLSSVTIDARNAVPLLQILVVTCAFLNTPYEKRFKKAEVSSKPVNNDEAIGASDPADQEYFLKNRKNGGYLKMAHGDVDTSIAIYKREQERTTPLFFLVPKEEASAFNKHALRSLYSLWLQENTLSKFNEFELIKAEPEKYLVCVPLPFPAADYRGCFTMDEINEMKKDPNIAIDWNKAVIEKEKDWKHPEVNGETTVFGEKQQYKSCN